VLLRSIVKGNLVPRELLERAEEDRDRLQNILDKERSDFMAPTLEVLQRLKVDYTSSGVNVVNEEDRGG
jgi:septum formation topological specificity factor MinE